MTNIEYIGVWLLFVAINILMAWQNNAVRRKREKEGNPKQIEHFWYFTGYCILCAIPFWFSRSYLQAISLLLLHGSIFPVSYNLYAGISPFSLSRTSKSIFDRLQVRLHFTSSEEINTLCFCFSIVILVYQIIFV